MPSIQEGYKGFTFGADPELFVKNLSTDKFVSAEGLIPGTKLNPYRVEKGAVQVDGMAAEFNIDPVDNYWAFDENITAVIDQLQGMLPQDHVLVCKPAVVFDEDVWTGSPDKAKELGCSPDFNAWTGSVNPPPHDPDNPRLRTASGHLHIGWTDGESLADPDHLSNCRDLVKQFDWYLGAWSLVVDPDPVRRRLYGKAGACRYKDYGVEYRVLSNFWVMDSRMRLQVWNRMQNAIRNISKSFLPDTAADFTGRLIQSIDTSTRDTQLESIFSNVIVDVKSKRRY